MGIAGRDHHSTPGGTMKPDDAVDCVLTINGEDHPITVSISPRTSATYRPNKAFDANGVLCREEDHPTLPPVLYMDGKGWINGRDDIDFLLANKEKIEQFEKKRTGE